MSIKLIVKRVALISVCYFNSNAEAGSLQKHTSCCDTACAGMRNATVHFYFPLTQPTRLGRKLAFYNYKTDNDS